MRRAMRRAMRRDETFHVWTTGSRTGSRSATEVYRPPDCPSIVDRTKLHFLSSGLSAFLLTLTFLNSLKSIAEALVGLFRLDETLLADQEDIVSRRFFHLVNIT